MVNALNPSLALVILVVLSPLLGALPLIDWITRGLTGKRLAQVGTGNVSVSAAFYHGGRWVGILAVLSEAGKGMAGVLLSRGLGLGAGWELVALVGLVAGRYWLGQGAGTTTMTWGYLLHDWVAALGVAAISGLYFAWQRQRHRSRWAVLVLIPLAEWIRSPQDPITLTAALTLSLLMGWIYYRMADDLDLSNHGVQGRTRSVFRFFQGKTPPTSPSAVSPPPRRILSLDDRLDPQQVGAKAATLSQLKRWGYGVPPGWVLPAGLPGRSILARVQPSPQQPWVVRSSAVGEDGEQASAAGQYQSVLQVTSPEALLESIDQVRDSYHRATAAQYRRDRGVAEAPMAVLVQRQVRGQLSGVAFSRDPLEPGAAWVSIEALPGTAEAVVSGQHTPQEYRIVPPASAALNAPEPALDPAPDPDAEPSPLDAAIAAILNPVASLARDLEQRYHGIPQDLEWSHDGQDLWLLQARPITTLQPLWTRKIAAEVIPGAIRPLTWSLNQPLTCGVWGELFQRVLGSRAQGLAFQATATLHNSHAYFNASLLGEIFLRMGLPPESLEFLTQGAKFSKPPLASTLSNVPGLLRLLQWEWQLERDFRRDDRQHFQPALQRLLTQDFSSGNLSSGNLSPGNLSSGNLSSGNLSSGNLSPGNLSPGNLDAWDPAALGQRLDDIRALLPRITYYQILAPLSFALRRALGGVADEALDQSSLPEVAALRSLQHLAQTLGQHLHQHQQPLPQTPQDLRHRLHACPGGADLWHTVEDCIQTYGYLSDVGTDIAVTNWRDDPTPAHRLLLQFIQSPPPPPRSVTPQGKARWLQPRLRLKGQVAQVYLQLLGEVRRSLLALAQIWVAQGCLPQGEDLFFLTFDEVRQGIDQGGLTSGAIAQSHQRREQWQRDQEQPVPFMVYGSQPVRGRSQPSAAPGSGVLQGIGASAGQVQGVVQVVRNLQQWPEVDDQTILVVPYTDAGWAPLLAQVAGVIAETGGRLSHGAIVAREYGIPAVMGVPEATQVFHTGQRVWLDGAAGTVRIVDSPNQP